MAQRGQRETERLRKNAEDQVTRLMTQLNDLDELRDVRMPHAFTVFVFRCPSVPRASVSEQACYPSIRDCSQELTDEEYESEKAITLQQLEEFNASLKRMIVSHVAETEQRSSHCSRHTCIIAILIAPHLYHIKTKHRRNPTPHSSPGWRRYARRQFRLNAACDSSGDLTSVQDARSNQALCPEAAVAAPPTTGPITGAMPIGGGRRRGVEPGHAAPDLSSATRRYARI